MSVRLVQARPHARVWKSHVKDNHSIGDSQEGPEGPRNKCGPSESSDNTVTDVKEVCRNLHDVGHNLKETTNDRIRGAVSFSSNQHSSDQSRPWPQSPAEHLVYSCNNAQVDGVTCKGLGDREAAPDSCLATEDTISDDSCFETASEMRSPASSDREFMDIDYMTADCACEPVQHTKSRLTDRDGPQLQGTRYPTRRAVATFDTKHNPIWKDEKAVGVTQASNSRFFQPCQEHFEIRDYEKRDSSLSTCARTRLKPKAVATTNIQLELEEKLSTTEPVRIPLVKDDQVVSNSNQKRTRITPNRTHSPGYHSPADDDTSRISTRESYSESERVSARVNDCHSVKAPRKQGALTKLVECHQYCCVDGGPVQHNCRKSFHVSSNVASCRSSIGIGFNENVLKPGVVCREQALHKETKTDNGLRKENGQNAEAANLADEVRSTSANSTRGNRKRLCKSLSNLTADDLSSLPRSSLTCKSSASQLRQQQNAAMSNSKSRIAKLITGHIRPTQNDAASAEEPPTNKKIAKRNGIHGAPNGLRKAKSVSDAISAWNGDKTSQTSAKLSRKTNPEFVVREEHRSTKTPDEVSTNVSSSRKTPKLPKALFPFMRKNRKRHNGVATGQRQPLKARGLENEADIQNANKSDKGPKLNKADGETCIGDGVVPIVGFRKIKVNSTPPQANVHADYASRVARMRRTSSSTDSETPANSPNPTCDRYGGAVLRNKTNRSDNDSDSRTNIRPRRNYKNRYSVDLSTESDSPKSHRFSRTKRPSSFAAPTGDQLWLESNMTSAKSDAQIRTLRGEHLPTGSHEQEQDGRDQNRLRQIQAKLRNHSVAVCQKTKDDSPAQHLDTHRCSLDMEYIRKGSFVDQLSFLSSLPGPETTIGSKSISSSLTGISTPRSTVPTTGGYASGPRCSLSSSFASVFDDEVALLKKTQNIENHTDVLGLDKKDTEPKTQTKMNLRLRRTQSLCKDHLTLKIHEVNRRSVSPSFESTNFGPSSNDGHSHTSGNTKILERRFQSLRDFSTLRLPQPNKPTTPKPRKMSSGSSCTSLNRFSFQLSQQNLAAHTSGFTQQNVEEGDAPALEFGELLPKASAKNASIRRRMSLQYLRSMNRDRDDEARKTSPTSTSQGLSYTNDVWKRHSLAELDIEKVKVTMARWSVGTGGNVATGQRNNRRKIRPLSEVQNLRWEVHAIPEHNELSSPSPAVETSSGVGRPRSLHLNGVASTTPLSGGLSVGCNDCGSRRRHLSVKQNAEHRVNLLGSSFSEENLSLYDEEMLPKVHQTQRSLSVIGGLNTVSECLMRFYPSKYYAEIACPCRGTAHPSTQRAGNLSPFSHGLHNYLESRMKVRASTMSGISNESGYGTMTRKGVFAKTAEDGDVFLHANSASRDDQTPNATNEDVVYVEALWDHVTMDNEELGFKVGDVIRVIDMTNVDWWWGELDSNEGWFPATFVRILVNQLLNDDVESIEIIVTPSPALRDDDVTDLSHNSVVRSRSVGDDLCQCTERISNSSIHCSKCGRPIREAHETPKSRSSTNPPKFQEVVSPLTITRKQSLCRETIRTNVINEIINSEKTFVGHLKDVVEGYLSRCKNRPDIFSDEQILTIFGNIEKLYHFQRDFFDKLESAVNRSCVSSSQLGNIFIEHKEGFAIYSEYCNNHPQALALLSNLLAQKKYVHFFEACRLLQKMIDIPLDGFLLTPVQKICKYPLQLAELLKYTSHDHPDNVPVQSALEAMKGVACMINERKRHMENIKKISLWQSSILNWQDKDVLERSSELVHSGELYTLSQTKGKPKWRMAFLFDHQMILCKKDILRRDLLYYKSRVDLDVCEVTQLSGDSPRNSSITGNDSVNGLASLQRGWRIVDTTTSESASIFCKNEEDFDKWSKAFSVERNLSEKKRSSLSEAEENLAKDLVQKSTLSRRAKETSSVRQPISYRYRVKMAQGADVTAAKQKNISMPSEKSAGFFSNMAGKLTPFRRATTRESNYVF